MKPFCELSDRELDALVAQEIMGWEYRQDAPKGCFCRSVGNHAGWWRSPVWHSNSWACGPCNDYPPHYSTDIASAWEVAQKLGLALIPQSDGPAFRWFAVDIESVRYGENITIVEKGNTGHSAATAPLAICWAALSSVQEESEE